jgi:uncharacterized protein involved in high-affinity Fe2+ transport
MMSQRQKLEGASAMARMISTNSKPTAAAMRLNARPVGEGGDFCGVAAAAVVLSPVSIIAWSPSLARVRSVC